MLIPIKYEQLDEFMVVLPQFMDWWQVGNPGNHNPTQSQGEGPIHKKAFVVKT